MKNCLIILLFLVSHNVLAIQYIATKENGQVSFKGAALGLNLEGVGEGIQGNIDHNGDINGEFRFRLDSLKTGIDLRDNHMKKNYLEVEKFPEAVLKVTKVDGYSPEQIEGEFAFQGTLSVHGVEKPVTNGKVRVKKSGDNLDVSATFDTKISEFQIPIPKYAGLALKDDVQVAVKTYLIPKPIKNN